MMKRTIKIISFGVVLILAFTFLSLLILLSTGLIVLDPGITDNQLSYMRIVKHSVLPYSSERYLNISEVQIIQCMKLKTICQDLIDNNQEKLQTQLNNSEFNCITSFLESLSPPGIYISWIYYQNYYFKLTFVVS